MKVIIQIPAYNEEGSLPITLRQLPRQLNGVDEVEWLIINDGSRDETISAAIAENVDYVISHRSNLGLAQAFLSGMTAALHFGADIIVNTDADNQYNAEDIQKLIDPIIQEKAEYVIGTRPIKDIAHWSPLKKRLQFLGSWVVRKAAKANVDDAPSGFRALTRAAAMRLHVFNRYTYTIETIIQAGHMHIPILCVPIRTNKEMRPSRLISSVTRYLQRSSSTIIRSFITYDPLRFFLIPSGTLLFATFVIGVRYLYFNAIGEGTGHVQSLILALAIFVLGTALLIVGLLADLISVNRQLLEGVDYRLKNLELQKDSTKTTEKQVFNRAYLTYRKK
ncbi:MAG: glycosyltransferase family 2 protein [Anaerolineae bacterium]|jgi:glycosyltransferase involved in cell wall biosynthesis|nr:glycosyltransferase family 2 protein [Anaerolineae bacterium]MBT7072407.1 glycosyltransferase family 2 protein [Anaerolineae bacterium]MBT7326243.1 glycosyltransferase family 2 protein [Anaerolineae bacterium]